MSHFTNCRTRIASTMICLAVTWVAVAHCSIAGGNESLAEANKLRLTGRYEEAATSYQRLSKSEPVKAAIGLARCHRAVGKLDEAEKLLTDASEKFPDAAVILAELSRLTLDRGDWLAAREFVDAALKLESNQLLARWVDAELLRVSGQLKKADTAHLWFVKFYNRSQKDLTDPEDLRWVGLAAAQYARWNRNSRQFSFIVNTLFPKALKWDKNYWPAYLESAHLFLEKYNEEAATNELNSAMSVNPNAAEIHAARAMVALRRFELATAQMSIARALEINPKLIDAHHLKSDLLMANFRLQDAADVLEAAKKLNPVHEETLGRLAAVYGAIDGLANDAVNTRLGKLIEQSVKRNEHCGQFFYTLAATLENLRKFPHAAKYYDEAQRRMPQLVGVRGRLGLMYMRLGEEVKAAALLDESFKIDPFNVRVKNMLAVLEVLKTYAVLETEHFVIKFDRGQDDVLAKYAAMYLEEEVYPEIVERLGYEPQGKSLFEIFSRSGRTSGHGWFSARMVGLPYIGTVGACAGKMVALASPNDTSRKYNWARVLKHEFVHVVNLQQTDFNIPHWFTEALAVWNEGYPRPSSWNDVLARRAAAKKLFDLDTINFGFARPGAGDDWTLAYCQAELYAEYMVKAYGKDSLAKMLQAYADNLSTGDAIRRSFNVSQKEFEDGYSVYVDTIVKALTTVRSEKRTTFAELQKAVQDDSKNADLLAELAHAYLLRGVKPDARKWALAAKEINDKHQLAAYVLARLYLSIGDTEQALGTLEKSFDEKAPQENALLLLAALRLKAERFDDAEQLYQLGAQKIPHTDQWLKLLARVYISSGDDDKLAVVLGQLAVLDSDNAPFSKKLAQIAMKKMDFVAATKWANQAIHIDVMDAQVHATLAEALVGQRQFASAIDAYETAIRLESEQLGWRLALASACVQSKQNDKARKVLTELLEIDPDFPGTKELMEKIKP